MRVVLSLLCCMGVGCLPNTPTGTPCDPADQSSCDAIQPFGIPGPQYVCDVDVGICVPDFGDAGIVTNDAGSVDSGATDGGVSDDAGIDAGFDDAGEVDGGDVDGGHFDDAIVAQRFLIVSCIELSACDDIVELDLGAIGVGMVIVVPPTNGDMQKDQVQGRTVSFAPSVVGTDTAVLERIDGTAVKITTVVLGAADIDAVYDVGTPLPFSDPAAFLPNGATNESRVLVPHGATLSVAGATPLTPDARALFIETGASVVLSRDMWVTTTALSGAVVSGLGRLIVDDSGTGQDLTLGGPWANVVARTDGETLITGMLDVAGTLEIDANLNARNTLMVGDAALVATTLLVRPRAAIDLDVDGEITARNQLSMEGNANAAGGSLRVLGAFNCAAASTVAFADPAWLILDGTASVNCGAVDVGGSPTQRFSNIEVAPNANVVIPSFARLGLYENASVVVGGRITWSTHAAVVVDTDAPPWRLTVADDARIEYADTAAVHFPVRPTCVVENEANGIGQRIVPRGSLCESTLDTCDLDVPLLPGQSVDVDLSWRDDFVAYVDVEQCPTLVGPAVTSPDVSVSVVVPEFSAIRVVLDAADGARMHAPAVCAADNSVCASASVDDTGFGGGPAELEILNPSASDTVTTVVVDGVGGRVGVASTTVDATSHSCALPVELSVGALPVSIDVTNLASKGQVPALVSTGIPLTACNYLSEGLARTDVQIVVYSLPLGAPVVVRVEAPFDVDLIAHDDCPTTDPPGGLGGNCVGASATRTSGPNHVEEIVLTSSDDDEMFVTLGTVDAKARGVVSLSLRAEDAFPKCAPLVDDEDRIPITGIVVGTKDGIAGESPVSTALTSLGFSPGAPPCLASVPMGAVSLDDENLVYEPPLVAGDEMLTFVDAATRVARRIMFVTEADINLYPWACGASTNDVDDGLNWVGGAVPNSSDAVYIPACGVAPQYAVSSPSHAARLVVETGAFPVLSAGVSVGVTGDVLVGGTLLGTGAVAVNGGTDGIDDRNLRIAGKMGALRVIDRANANVIASVVTLGNLEVNSNGAMPTTRANLQITRAVTVDVGGDLLVNNAGLGGRITLAHPGAEIVVHGSAEFAPAAIPSTFNDGTVRFYGDVIFDVDSVTVSDDVRFVFSGPTSTVVASEIGLPIVHVDVGHFVEFGGVVGPMQVAALEVWGTALAEGSMTSTNLCLGAAGILATGMVGTFSLLDDGGATIGTLASDSCYANVGGIHPLTLTPCTPPPFFIGTCLSDG